MHFRLGNETSCNDCHGALEKFSTTLLTWRFGEVAPCMNLKKRVMLQELDIEQTPGSATEGQFDRVQKCKNLGKWDDGQTQRNWIIQTSWTMDEYL